MTAAPTIKPKAPSVAHDRWGFGEGEEIAPGRHALKLLGGGKRFEAYLAHDEELLSSVVVKILRPSVVSHPSALRGLAAEWQMLQSLNHPCICRGYDAVLTGERPHITLEFLEGPRLSSLIRKFGRLDLDQLIPLATQVASALHYLHRRDIVHLDVKPQNIIMGGPPRLIDLSVARPLPTAARTGVGVGTDAYMAPEQAHHDTGLPVGPAADSWGLGVTLFEALTGRLPYPRGNDADPHPQTHTAPDPVPSSAPPEVAAIIDACLQRDAAARPTPKEIAEALEAAGSQRPRRLVLGRMKPGWG